MMSMHMMPSLALPGPDSSIALVLEWSSSVADTKRSHNVWYNFQLPKCLFLKLECFIRRLSLLPKNHLLVKASWIIRLDVLQSRILLMVSTLLKGHVSSQSQTKRIPLSPRLTHPASTCSSPAGRFYSPRILCISFGNSTHTHSCLSFGDIRVNPGLAGAPAAPALQLICLRGTLDVAPRAWAVRRVGTACSMNGAPSLVPPGQGLGRNTCCLSQRRRVLWVGYCRVFSSYYCVLCG